MATATPPISPTPTPSVIAPLKPGRATSEGALSLIVTLLTAAAANPWVGTMPPLYKAISAALAVVTVVFYQAQRTSLKKAHLAASTGYAVPAQGSSVAGIAVKAGAVACVLALIAGAGVSCGGSGELSQIGNAAGSAGLAGLECEGVNLEGIVGVGSDGKNISLLEQIGIDVLSANFTAAIADLVKGFGSITIGCAVLAADDLESGLASLGSASGSGAIATNAMTVSAQGAAQISLERLRTLETAYGWKRAPRKTLQRNAALTGKP